jgi:putative transcriptional regulator
MAIVVDLSVEMARRNVSVTHLAARVGITTANMSLLKNGHAKAVRLTTLDAICRELGCQPGDLLRYVPDED